MVLKIISSPEFESLTDYLYLPPDKLVDTRQCNFPEIRKLQKTYDWIVIKNTPIDAVSYRNRLGIDDVDFCDIVQFNLSSFKELVNHLHENIDEDEYQMNTSSISDSIDQFNQSSRPLVLGINGLHVVEFLSRKAPEIKRPFIILTYNFSDMTFRHLPDSFSHPMIIKWYGRNLDFYSPIVHPLPIGLRCENSQSIIKRLRSQNHPKIQLAAFNFTVSNHTYIRQPIYDTLINNGFLHVRHENLETYMINLAQSKFCFSPPGRGLDCWKTWEALYLGTIPVVTRSPFTEHFAEHLPMLLVDDWTKITPEYLEQSYLEINSNTNIVKKYDNYLDFNYYRNLISNQIKTYKHITHNT